MIATWVLLGCALVLAAAGRPAGHSTHWRVVGVYGVVAVSGVARAFLQPARTALAAAMVPREMQANAITWRSTTWQLGAVIGPAIGGILNAAVGPRGSYLADGFLIVIALVALCGGTLPLDSVFRRR